MQHGAQGQARTFSPARPPTPSTAAVSAALGTSSYQMVPRDSLITPNPKLKLLDQIREVMRLKHYSIRTETAYCDWAKRYIKFYQMQRREDLQPAPLVRSAYTR
jgi:Phage integrase, N-terminal SAM-like domain